MKTLPDNVKPYKKTPTFTEESIPIGLFKSHTTKPGTWGKICINKGKLLYTIEVEPNESIELSPTEDSKSFMAYSITKYIKMR